MKTANMFSMEEHKKAQYKYKASHRAEVRDAWRRGRAIHDLMMEWTETAIQFGSVRLSHYDAVLERDAAADLRKWIVSHGITNFKIESVGLGDYTLLYFPTLKKMKEQTNVN